jgi:hypothetical protein
VRLRKQLYRLTAPTYAVHEGPRESFPRAFVFA